MARPSRDIARSSMRDQPDAGASRECKRSKCELTESGVCGWVCIFFGLLLSRYRIQPHSESVQLQSPHCRRLNTTARRYQISPECRNWNNSSSQFRICRWKTGRSISWYDATTMDATLLTLDLSPILARRWRRVDKNSSAELLSFVRHLFPCSVESTSPISVSECERITRADGWRAKAATCIEPPTQQTQKQVLAAFVNAQQFHVLLSYLMRSIYIHQPALKPAREERHFSRCCFYCMFYDLRAYIWCVGIFRNWSFKIW